MNDDAERTSLSTKHLTPAIGTEVSIDTSALIEGVHADQLRKLLRERGVLVFRKIGLSDEELIAFAETIGPVFNELGEGVMTMSLDKNKAQVSAYLRASQFWHIDNVSRSHPNFASMLIARELPNEGGETEFANMYAAWEDLPEEKKRELADLQVNHCLNRFSVALILTPRQLI